jgi:hypothetical protein
MPEDECLRTDTPPAQIATNLSQVLCRKQLYERDESLSLSAQSTKNLLGANPTLGREMTANPRQENHVRQTDEAGGK